MAANYHQRVGMSVENRSLFQTKDNHEGLNNITYVLFFPTANELKDIVRLLGSIITSLFLKPKVNESAHKPSNYRHPKALSS